MPVRTAVGAPPFDDGPDDGAWRNGSPCGDFELRVAGLLLPCRARRERIVTIPSPTRELVMVETRYANTTLDGQRYKPEPSDCLSLFWRGRPLTNYPRLDSLFGRFRSFTDIAEAYFYVAMCASGEGSEPRRVIWRWEPLPE